MKLSTSYRQIFSIALPIMLGSAAQNVIVLTDNVFLYHKSSLEFASIGLIGVFYLIIAAIGYGFSRGGQIIMARRYGQDRFEDLRKSFHALFFFEMLIALILFLFLQFGSHWFFSIFINADDILTKSLEYIYPRSYGIFFSYIGVSLIALYTGIARTKFIIIDTVILGIVNVILNYILIYGHFGFPEMGIAGAGWASTIAEIVAFVVFVIYMLLDKEIRAFKIFIPSKVNKRIVREIYKISTPMVAQAVLSIGSWFFLFSLIENLGQRSLEVSNLIRNVYLILSIPCWGFSTAINTIVSNFIGQDKRQAVLPLIKKTAFLNLMITLVISIPVLIFPEYLLWPLFGGADMSLIEEAKGLFIVLLLILIIFSWGAIYFNGLLGTGDTRYGLKIQAMASLLYVIYIYFGINVYELDIKWIWGSEIVYWVFITTWTYLFLIGKKWYTLRI